MKWLRSMLSLPLKRLATVIGIAIWTMLLSGCEVATPPNPVSAPSAETTHYTQPASAESVAASAATDDGDESSSSSASESEATTIPEEINPNVTTTSLPTSTPVAATVETELQLRKPVVTLSDEQRQLWSVAKPEEFRLLKYQERPASLTLVTCSETIPTSDSYLTGGTTLCLWSQVAAEPKWSVPIDGGSGDATFITCISCSADGQRAVVGDSKGTIRVCSITDGNVLVDKKLHPGKVFAVAFSPDGKSIASIGSDSKVTISAAESLAPTSSLAFDTSGVQRIAYLGNDSMIAMGEKAAVYNIRDERAFVDLPTPRFGFGLSPSASYALLATEERILQIAPGQAGPVTVVEGTFARDERAVLSADGKILATVNGEAIRLWDMNSKRCVQWIDVAGDTVVGLHWSPNANLLTSVHALGPTRVWGTAATGEANKFAGVQPMMPAATDTVSKIQPAAAWHETIDLRSFPIPKYSKLQIAEPTTVSFQVEMVPDDAKAYARYQLGELGWLEEVSTANPNSIAFHKAGFVLTSSFYEAQPGQTSVNMNLSGLDLRTLPRLAGEGVQEVFADRNTLLVRSKADITSLEVELLRKFREFGCVPFVALNTSRNVTPDQRTLAFLLGPVQLNVMINRAPTAPDSYTISYAAFPALSALPIPTDVDYVEFTGAPVPVLVLTSTSSVAELLAFYDRAMAEAGWQALMEHRQIKEEQATAGYLRDGRDVTLRFSRTESGPTLVTAGDVSANNSYTLSLLLKPNETFSTKSDMTDSSMLEAADFPVPPAAINRKLDRVAQIIEFEVQGTTLTKLTEAITAQLVKLGWKADQGGIRGDDYTFFEFEKGDLSIEFRATDRNGTALVNVQGDGLGWTKDPAGASKLVPYEQWLIDHQKLLSMAELDAFAAEQSK